MTQSLKKNAAWLATLQIAQSVIGFLGGVVIARFLGPSSRGILALFGIVTLLITQMTDLGLSSAGIYFLSKKRYSPSVINTNAIVWSFGIGLVLLSVFFLIDEAILGHIFPDLPLLYLFLAVLITPFSLYMFQWSGILTGLDQIRRARQFSFVNQAITFAFIAFSVLIMRWPLATLIYFSVLYNIFSTVVAFFLLCRQTPLKFLFDFQALKQCISYGLPLHLGLILNTFHLRIDVFILQFFQGSEQVGFYVVAVSLVESLQYLESALMNASIFRLTNRPEAESRELTCRLTRHLAFVVGIVAILMSLLSYPLILLVYGSLYVPSILPLNILIPGILAFSLAKPAAVFVAYQIGLSKVNLMAAFLGLSLNLLFNLLLIPQYGILGAALASTLSYLSVFLFMISYFIKLSNSSLKEILIFTREDFDVYKNIVLRVKEKLLTAYEI